jgi:GNAT superfamily N-acetyltransferase
LYILKAYQNRGYGSKITKIAVKKLVDLGYNSLIVWALQDNYYCIKHLNDLKDFYNLVTEKT